MRASSGDFTSDFDTAEMLEVVSKASAAEGAMAGEDVDRNLVEATSFDVFLRPELLGLISFLRQVGGFIEDVARQELRHAWVATVVLTQIEGALTPADA